ncbi:MAG: efflux RND transporter periplasmic adaptor subunit [Spirochaetales bacterium]|jgi:HlyD family secretion protein|nr:efflux RND transporter periplasmic adaptor subunit [Spirochaetales bacterium]
MKSRTLRWIIILTLLAAIAAVVTYSLIGNEDSPGSRLEFDYYRVSTDAMEERISGTGTFVPSVSAEVMAKVSGTIESVKVAEGDYVRAGTVLLEIDTEDYQKILLSRKAALESTYRSAKQNLLSLRASYENALLNYGQADRLYNNDKALFNADGISQEKLNQSRDAFSTAELNLKSAKERLNLTVGFSLDSEPVLDDSKDNEIISSLPEIHQAELSADSAAKDLERCTVRAPISGTVSQVFIKDRDIASPNALLLKIEALNNMLAEIQIDEVDIGKVRAGNSATVTSDSLIGVTLNGTVKTISPVIQRVGNTRMSKVVVVIDSDGNRLKSGASCTVRISTITKENALVIPLTAYTNSADKFYVFVLVKIEADSAPINSDRYILEKREITLGITTISQVEVLSGLSEGELLAIGNQSLFREAIEGVLREEK